MGRKEDGEEEMGEKKRRGIGDAGCRTQQVFVYGSQGKLTSQCGSEERSCS